MRHISRFSSRPAALAAVGVGGAALLLLARPLRGQQGPFTVQTSIPATAGSGATTEVSYSFSFPIGFHLQRNPRVRVTDAGGRLVELLPMYIDQQAPTWAGHRGLHTVGDVDELVALLRLDFKSVHGCSLRSFFILLS